MPHVIVTRNARHMLLELRTLVDLHDEQEKAASVNNPDPVLGSTMQPVRQKQLENTRAEILALAHRLVREAVKGKA